MKTITHHFDTEEKWLAFKENITVSASTIGSITGLNKYTSPFDEWERKTGRSPKLETTLAMKIGSYGEELVMRIFKDDYEIEYLRDRSKILLVQSKEYPFIAVSPDDIAVYEGEEMLAEIKTTKVFIDEEDIPKYYEAQVNFQMGITGYKKCILIWLNFMKTDYGFKVFEFDEDYFNVQLETAIQFNDCVVNDVPPPPVNISDFNKIETTEGEVEADDKISEILYKMYEANEKAKSIKNDMDYYKLQIAKFLNDKTVITIDGKKVLTYKEQHTNRVDTKKLKDAGLYDEYSKTTVSRKMTPYYKNL